MRLILIGVGLAAWLGCGTNEAVVEVAPSIASRPTLERTPPDPFPSSSADSAYARLKRITDATSEEEWNRDLESFEPWIESQSKAVEEAVSLLRQLRATRRDQYAVGNGRIALVYSHLVVAVEEAERMAVERDQKAFKWVGKGSFLREQASGFWGRCKRGASAGGPHLDAWRLWCEVGLRSSQASVARQPK